MRDEYRYNWLPIEISRPPDILQVILNGMIEGFDFTHAFIYNLLMIITGDWKYNYDKMEPTLIDQN